MFFLEQEKNEKMKRKKKQKKRKNVTVRRRDGFKRSEKYISEEAKKKPLLS